MFDLSFEEAIKKCLNKEGFIQGDDFAPGTYVKRDEHNTLMVCKSRDLSHIPFPLLITLSVYTQKYRLLISAIEAEKQIL